MILLNVIIAITSLFFLIGLVWDAVRTGEGMNFWGCVLLVVLLLAGVTISPSSKSQDCVPTELTTYAVFSMELPLERPRV
jgi:hypothetical protein